MSRENFKPCFLEALRLQEAAGGEGEVVWVDEGDECGHSTGHFYYVANPSRLDDPALNASDNGYTRFPQYDVRTVLERERIL